MKLLITVSAFILTGGVMIIPGSRNNSQVPGANASSGHSDPTPPSHINANKHTAFKLR